MIKNILKKKLLGQHYLDVKFDFEKAEELVDEMIVEVVG